MIRTAGRALATGVIGALAGAVCAVILYAWHPAIVMEFDRDLPTNLTGIYPPERDDRSRLTFAWTGADAVVRLPGLDRRAAWTLTLRVRGGREVAADNPDLTILADGIPVGTLHTTAAFEDLHAAIPAAPDHRGLILELHASRTVVPGPRDRRALGAMLDRLELAPNGAVLLPRPAIRAAAASSAALGAAVALLGVTAGSAIGGTLLLAAGDGAIVGRGLGPFSAYPATVWLLGVWIAAALAIAAIALEHGRRQPLRNTARFAVAFSACALFLKLLVLLHPDMPIGDAMFHAHRFENVVAGHLYFTSIAPGGYSFPYAPGLYVFSWLFSGLVTRGAGDVALLRIVTSSVDAVAALLLYRAIVIAWSDRLAGAAAVALYHLIPLEFAVFTTANLTNAFAQSVSVAALWLMASPRMRLQHAGAAAALMFVLLAAYLSHASTFAILFVSTVVVAVLFR
ncbi:MAG TPA: hypothetical protein VGL62_10445, partial [Vicinamibacterales bacterium]